MPRKGSSRYATQNWCRHCQAWKIGKPVKCPDCNYRTRSDVHYNNGRYVKVKAGKRY